MGDPASGSWLFFASTKWDTPRPMEQEYKESQEHSIKVNGHLY